MPTAPLVVILNSVKDTDLYRIAEAARLLGVHPDTLRNLERRGLMRARRDWAGARRYALGDLERLRALLFPAAATPLGTEPR